MKTTAQQRGAKAELMSGKGYLFLTVMLLSPWKSMHGLSVPSFLLMKKKPAPRGEEEGLIIPTVGESQMYFSIASYTGQERLYNQLLGRGAPGWRLMAQSYSQWSGNDRLRY